LPSEVPLARARPSEPARRDDLGLGWLVLQVATFASRYANRAVVGGTRSTSILLLLVTAVWIARGLPRPPVIGTVAVCFRRFALALPADDCDAHLPERPRAARALPPPHLLPGTLAAR
jgi:hypothetical protein